MNPQQNNDAAALKARLNQLPPARPATPVNVPSRSQGPNGAAEDIDDSAFAIGGDTPRLVAPPPDMALPKAPALPPAPRPQVPITIDITPPRPVAPAPQSKPAPPAQPVVLAAPVPPAQPPAPAAPLPPQQPVTATPQPAPQPVPPTYTIAPPMPSTLNTVAAPPSQPIQMPPKPAPIVAAVPQPTAPATPVAFQPPAEHISRDVVERIDETPQQNSSDIEHLIQHTHRLKRIKGFASFMLFLAGVVFAAFLLNQFVFQSYYVDGTSMTPTLQNDDRLIIDKVGHTWSNLQGKSYLPERGQIVVLDSSIVGLNGREEQLIKRAIGLPGDTVIIKDGVVTIKNKENPDGFEVDKKLGLRLQPTYTDAPVEITIPENEVFVMGDNRVENGSYDSRAFGPIKADKIVGRLWARILPLDKAQVF